MSQDELRDASITAMLQSSEWQEFALPAVRELLTEKKDFLAHGRGYNLEEMRLLQGEIKVLEALADNPEDFFNPDARARALRNRPR